jgi:hypothetical protein
MENIFLIATTISIIYFILKFVEMKFVDKETKPLKVLIRDTLLVFFSVIVGVSIIDQFYPILKERQTSPVVFTDNPEKAQETIDLIGLKDFKVLGPKDTYSQCENLWLMACSTSFIGANSSYSWWAAYLNTNLKTQPIFPRQWYMNPDLSNNDMLLPDWISVGFDKFLNEEATRGVNLG